MQDSPQSNATVGDFHSDERTDPILECANKYDTARIASTTAAAASIVNIQMATSDSPLHSVPPGIGQQVNEDDADLDIDDTNVILGSARELPASSSSFPSPLILFAQALPPL